MAAAPTELKLALSPHPQCAGWAGCSPPRSMGLLAGERRSQQSAERDGCKIQVAGQQQSQVSSDRTGGRRCPHNRPYLPEWHIRPPPFVSFRAAAATQAVLTRKTTSYYRELGPPQPPFLTEIRTVPLPAAAVPDFWLLLRSKPYLIFPPPTSSSSSSSQNVSQQRCSEQKRKHSENTWGG